MAVKRSGSIHTEAATGGTPAALAAPKTLEEAEARIGKALGRKAEVSQDPGLERVEVRFSAKDQKQIDKALEFIGVQKQDTGIRMAYSFGKFEVAVSPYQSALAG